MLFKLGKMLLIVWLLGGRAYTPWEHSSTHSLAGLMLLLLAAIKALESRDRAESRPVE